jgi:beta-glucosidase-like glycosyl hydrolase
MVGHLSIPAFDSLPASLSGHIITDLLRDELGYQGLVLTDALNMHALNDIANVPSKCINAGADILLHPADADSTVEELGKAVASGEVDEAKIDTAVERIFTYKAEFHTIQRPAVNYSVHADLSDLLSDRTITLVKDSGGILPIRHIHDTALYFSADKNRHDVSMLKDFISPLIDVADCKGGTLKERVVISLFTRVEAWQGSSGIHPDEIRTVRGIIDRAHKSVVISFGSPYVLRHFNEADVLIAAYDASPQAQRSVIKCLTGEIKCRGTLPVRISRF